MPRRTGERIGRRQAERDRRRPQAAQPEPRVLICPVEPGRKVKCLDIVMQTRPADDRTRTHSPARCNLHLAEIRVRGLEPTSMVDRHRKHPRNRTGESDGSSGGRHHRSFDRHTKVDTPVATVRADGGELGDDRAVNRRHQTGAWGGFGLRTRQAQGCRNCQ